MKKWLLWIISGICAGTLLIAGFNFITDPFGVFGDRVMNWYSYNMTSNPRIAKFGYLSSRYENYNGYIIGNSKSSSLSPLMMNNYYEDANFYNLMTYGANMAHMEKIAYYVIDNYNAKHIILCLGMSELLEYGVDNKDEKQQLHAKVSGEPLLPFYLKYLFLNPKYSVDKWTCFISNDKKLQPTTSNVFFPETGVYNKTRRDKEDIVNIEDYICEIGGGNAFERPAPAETVDPKLCISAAARVKEYCDSKGVSFDMISTPSFDYEIQIYDEEAMSEYWQGLAEIMDFWNFSGYSAISFDPRHFYDTFHFRNITGEMVLGKAYEDPSVFWPEDFGLYFTKDNAKSLSDKLLSRDSGDITGAKTAVPILIYHHIIEDTDAGEAGDLVWVSAGTFKAHMSAIKDAGYTTLLFQDLIDYADGKRDLPEKPIFITFDDGYASNYEYAFPVLRELNMKATISVVGWSVGRDSYPDGRPIIPHFDWEQAKEMAESGLIDIQNHSYGMHKTGESARDRKGVLPEDGEATAYYANLLQADNAKFVSEMKQHIGREPIVFTYPYGYATLLSEEVLRGMGYKVTLLTGDKISRVTKGDPYSLYGLYRIGVENTWSAADLLLKLR